jgi:recombination protein RecA
VAELARVQKSLSKRSVTRVSEEERSERAKTLRLSFAGGHGDRAGLEPAAKPVEGRAPLWSHFRTGQLLELSGHAPGKLSMAARLIARAQAEGEPVAWLGARDASGFYPPDFAQVGVELAALVVVRMPVEPGSHALLRASEVLLRSGAFGLVVIDFGSMALPRGELSWQARLSGLVRKHDARMVLLTGSAHDVPSLGPLIGLRVTPELEHTPGHAGRAWLTPRVLKSKLGEEAALSPDLRSLPVGASWG